MDWNSLFCEDRIRPSESMAERKSGKDPRTEFDSDFGRVVFSSAARMEIPAQSDPVVVL